jgi:hypothetical protein
MGSTDSLRSHDRTVAFFQKRRYFLYSMPAHTHSIPRTKITAAVRPAGESSEDRRLVTIALASAVCLAFAERPLHNSVGGREQ